MQKELDQNYRTIIGRELEARKRRRSGYSLRAFARDLKIPAPKLSQILNGVCGISRVRAVQIATIIGLSTEEKEFFISLVEAEHSRSPIDRKRAQERLEKLKEDDGFASLSIERFKIISDWYHAALLELPKLKKFNSTPKWISARLGIEKKQAVAAIERLVDFGLLEEDSESLTLKRTKNHLATPSGIPTREIREHHSQILSKADQALELPVTERDFSAITMAIDSSRLDEAKEKLKEFRREFCKEIQTGHDKDRIYCLAIQFFPLDKE
ncbi:MAG: TIGR02147 family protein [Bacteriovorax sp.]